MRETEAFLGQSAALAPFERMTRAELDQLLLAKLRRQLARARRTNPFYRRVMDSAKVAPEDIRSLADFRRIPLSNKDDFLADQRAAPPFGTRLGVPREEVVLVNMTSGTSGKGQEVYGRTQHDVAVQGFLHYLPWYMAGLRPGQMALNCVPAGGLTTGGWGPPEGFRIAGATAVHAGGALSTDAKVDFLERFRELHFIYASTNYMHTLTEAFHRRGIRPADLLPMMRGIFIVGEGYPAEWARAIEDAWQCRVHEGYGSTQGAGFICATCERGAVRADGRRSLMHIFEWLNYTEVVNPETGAPVGPGEEGELILTNLDIQGSPVIRFATRDKGRWFPHDACDCGRAWHCIEAGGVGRYDDMLKIRGNNVWPLAVDQVIFAHPEVAEYTGRVYVDDAGRTEVEIRLALKSESLGMAEPARERLLAAIRDGVKERTNVLMRFRVVPVAELPQYLYKARRWTDERKSGYAAKT